ncbi:MAG: amino acid adenylation domain-containing protein, partial [bacterium]|nr:amino acid adenylation domain-containing protein [bacterium]
FSLQATTTPNEIAVRDTADAITYQRLDQKSAGLAHQLIDRGAGPGTIIAVKMERSIEMVTAILAILKTGAAYLPVDPDSPPDRSDFMMRDSNAVFMVTHGDIGPIGQIGPINPIGPIGPDNPAYVMYTSGTTGRPKGVVIRHRSVINISLWIAESRNITAGTRVLQMADCTFDTSVEDMFGTLLRGGTLYTGSRQISVDKEAFRAYVNEHQIELINFVPTLMGELLDHEEKLVSLRTVNVGGEKLTPTVRDRVLSKGYRLFNNYGPTEVTVDALSCECLPDETIYIGKPVFNSRCYILDSNRHPVPIGVPGEICIAGDGVAAGYLNRPELTNEKFVEIEKEQASRRGTFPTSFTPIYHTGDLGRWSVDGNVEFLGRLDQQVKINGHRIELGEIEAAIMKWDNIKETGVIFDSDSLQLWAYFTHHPAYSISGLKEFLALSLPHYMIPARFIPLEKIPLTANGKIDKDALPLPEESAGNISTYRAPATPVEKELAAVCRQLLGREVIGLEDDFFRLGGDSIKALQVTSRMQRAGYKLEMKHLFQFPRISQLAPHVKPLERIPDQSPVTGIVPLTPIQARFFENPLSAPHHFNQSLMLHVDEPLEEEALRAVFTHLQHHHDALRMTFPGKEGKIHQQNRDINFPLSLRVYDLGDGAELETRADEIQASINLETGPLMKIALFNLEESSRLLIVIHHLVIDTVSWRILLEDINLLFRQYRAGHPLELPRKSDSYKTWAEQISYYSNSTAFLKEKEYWQQIESVDIPPIANDSNGKNLSGRSEKISFNLTEEETEKLLTNVNQAFGTEINDILLTGLLLAVNCCFGLNKTAVALEGHGREEIIGDMDISRTVGWFTSLFPVVLERVENKKSKNLPRQIIAVKEHLHRVPRRGIGYGILRYLTDGENKEDIHFKLKPQISFNYLGQFDSDLEQGDFKRATESAGNNSNPDEAREYLLDVAGLITGKQLTISIAFDQKEFTGPQVFADHYQTQLVRIINYCASLSEKRLTPIDLTYPHLSMDQLEELTNQFTLQDIYPLSPMQEGMLFHSLMEPDAPVYFEQMSYRMKGRFDIPLVRKSLEQLIKRHDILRTVFLPGDRNRDRPLQLVREECPPDFYYKDISTLNSKDKETFLKSFKEQDRGNHFNLSKGPLMRTAMIRLDEEEYDVTWSIHHILMDGWCNRILNTEFFEIYNSYRHKKKPRLLPVTPYRSYIQWLEEQDRQASRDYWSDYLEDFDQAAGIPRFSTAAAKTGPKESRNVLFAMDKNRTAALVDLAARNHVTVNTVIQASWSILLGVYNGSRDVVFGAVVSGRPAHIDGIETMVGLFINTIPVRIRYDENTP